MAYRHTIISAKAFHFRVRDGNGWDHLAMATRLSDMSGYRTMSKRLMTL
jgi:hypothetical protein